MGHLFNFHSVNVQCNSTYPNAMCHKSYCHYSRCLYYRINLRQVTPATIIIWRTEVTRRACSPGLWKSSLFCISEESVKRPSPPCISSLRASCSRNRLLKLILRENKLAPPSSFKITIAWDWTQPSHQKCQGMVGEHDPGGSLPSAWLLLTRRVAAPVFSPSPKSHGVTTHRHFHPDIAEQRKVLST